MASQVPGFGLSQIGQIAVSVKDVDKAVAFYRDVLGLKLLFQAPPGLAFFDCGGVRLMLARPEKPEFDHPASTIYFKVADIRQATATLKARGARFEDEPRLIAKMPDHDLWMAFFRDGEHNLLGLMSEARPR
jgi:methylmalonyl-CoA/ethylmalonyl-CoA epimerase